MAIRGGKYLASHFNVVDVLLYFDIAPFLAIQYAYMRIILICTIFLLSSLAYQVNARHIVGGEVTYRCVGINTTDNTVTFEITVLIYRDSYGGGAPFDDPADFGLYIGSGSNWEHVRTYIESSPIKRNIDIETGNPCLETPDNIGVEEGKYVFDITVPISETESYQIVYQRCCRNNTIFNILDPDVTGAAYSVEISPLAQRQCDNSPTFDEFPPVVICANSKLRFDHSATDVDGDRISYTFCDPIAAGGIRGINGQGQNECDGITPSAANCPPPYPVVNFRIGQGYTTTTPLGGDPVVELDPVTGVISGVPNVVGQFVVGVCATTIRDGQVINVIRRDFQFNVTPCEIAVQANIAADEIIGGEQFIVNSCGDYSVEFENLSFDITKITSYDWEFYIGPDTLKLETRDANITFPDTGSYNAMLFLNRDEQFADCKDTAEITVNIFPEVQADFGIDYDTCIAGPIDFTDLSVSGAGPILTWDWDFGDGMSDDVMNPSNIYQEPGEKLVQLIVTDKNECSDVVDKSFQWFPAPPILIAEPDQFRGCVPATITFNNLSSPINESYEVLWDFGDGTTVDEISPSHIYTETGVYEVTLDVTSPIGCQIETSFGEWITVLNSPKAGFTYTPEKPSNFNKEVAFTDQSMDAIAWLYNFDGIAKLEQNPTYTFPDTGLVEVVQVVTHETGCTDTATAIIDVQPLVTLQLPNAFTPNDDGLNDDFRGKGYFDGFREYTMQIYNRWGEKIYEGSDPNVGWDGKHQRTGGISPPGVYVYTVEYLPPRGSKKQEKGHVTLIR